ncbi:pyrroline-5-carboxylate reductase [Mesorhizobium sp. B263B2A]|uniref:pyrroline-5-carboxylate reductase n=1 Tax=Mesorhizobium sp. B263B2A TaxID=2876669 RepID=UPI001CD09B94|nr:pyrroline-5-carboxylate reductase [Mesorhizobium sp. B263B2A]MCA0033623.1 NAD(P)-binding domain-containing protein [Mesorhizobium sp. B263B2A]
MKLGFLGTGALTAAIVTGLKSGADNPVSVVLSPRNEEIAANLASRFPNVRVAADNQAVLDACDTVMLAVRPQIAHQLLPELRFRRDHHLISLIATLSREEIIGLTAPVSRVTKALPMPMIAHRLGATIIYPPDPGVRALLGGLGNVIEVDSSSEFDALSVVTATYATYFKYLDTIHRWLEAHGVPDTKGRDYLYRGALQGAGTRSGDADFTHLAQDYATRGGINEQVLGDLTARNVFDALTESLDSVHRHISAAGAT